MLLLLFNHHRRRLRTHLVTLVNEFLSAPTLWRGVLWLAAGFAVFALVPAVSPTLSGPPLAAQQAQAPAPQASQAKSPAAQASQGKPPAPQGSQAQAPAPQAAQGKPPVPQASQAKPPAPQGSQAQAPAPQAAQGKPPVPQASQAQPPAPGTTPVGPSVPQPSQPVPSPSTPPQTPPAGQTTPAEQAPPTSPPTVAGGPGVGFRLENADLMQFINLVASELKVNYVLDPAVKGAVTISTSGELKPEDLLPILETVLKMNGATAIKTGNFYRIIPLVAAPKTPLSLYSGDKELPADDRMLMEIVPLKFVFAADMAKMLTPFLSEGGTVTVLDAGNTLILVDDSLNVKRLTDILQQFDNTSFAAQRVRLLPVRNNVASALVPELQEIFSTYALSDKQTPLRFLPLDRINGILVAAADPGAFAEVEQWIGKLDQPATPNGIQTFVYKVQYAEADHLVRLLNILRGIGGGPSGAGGQGTSGRGREGVRGGGGSASLQEEAFQASSSEVQPGLGPFGQTGAQGTGTTPVQTLRIVTDAVSNSIIVQGTAQEYADIAKTLEKLDVLPRQVLIEARVYEVDLTGTLSLGLEYSLQHRGAGTTPLQFLGDYGVSSAGALTGSTGVLIGQTRQLMAFLNASENHSRVKTLSAPTVLTTDSTEARIQVGASVPTLSSQGLAQGGQIAGNSLYTSTVQNVDTGIILTVTPRITSTGLVSLHINQEVSTEQPPAATGIQSPSFNKRSVFTQAVAQDGQTIALGGLISYTYTKTIARLPLLGDIPWLGALFGTTSWTTAETELIVLLTPRVISTLPSATMATRELEDKLKELRREFKKDDLLKR